MDICDAYHADKNFLGEIGVCWGTKEREACSCGGDGSKCDFYEEKRKKATPKITHADCIRAMTDEELIEFIYKLLNEFCPAAERPGNCIANCRLCWSQWLKQEARK